MQFLLLSLPQENEKNSQKDEQKNSDRDCLGIGSMFNFVRIWSNLVQITAIVKANRVDMPKTLRIFVHYYSRACVTPGPSRDPG